MIAETLLAAGYSVALLLAAGVLEWLSAHTHRRSLRYRTAGFEFHDDHDVWVCPEGEHLWPHEVIGSADSPATALEPTSATPARSRSTAPTPTTAERSSARSTPGHTPRPGASTA